MASHVWVTQIPFTKIERDTDERHRNATERAAMPALRFIASRVINAHVVRRTRRRPRLSSGESLYDPSFWMQLIEFFWDTLERGVELRSRHNYTVNTVSRLADYEI